jgi:aldehyde:ferredoxin oxidoreductase
VVKGVSDIERRLIDTISGGNLAFCMDAWERRFIDSSQTDGIEMTWGNAGAMLECLRKIINRGGRVRKGCHWRKAATPWRNWLGKVPKSSHAGQGTRSRHA